MAPGVQRPAEQYEQYDHQEFGMHLPNILGDQASAPAWGGSDHGHEDFNLMKQKIIGDANPPLVLGAGSHVVATPVVTRAEAPQLKRSTSVAGAVMPRGTEHSSKNSEVGKFFKAPGKSFRVQQSVDLDPALTQSLLDEVKNFLACREGSCLRAWVRHLDRNHDEKISMGEFIRGMRMMDFPGDATALFMQLDADKSGELSLEEIDCVASDFWRRFKVFCVEKYESPRDMLMRLAGSRERPLDRKSFTENVRTAGWHEGMEDVLFDSMDIDDTGIVGVGNLKWLEAEKKRQKRKEDAKRRSSMDQLRRDNERRTTKFLLLDFKDFLKRKFGNCIRAWRAGLDKDGSMSLQKVELFKACTEMGYRGDVRLLWHAFDKDDSGVIGLEELDARSAETLAFFRSFVLECGGSQAAFHVLDKFNTRKLKQQEFVANCKASGFSMNLKMIFSGLDLERKGLIVETDLSFLDKWKPPSYLTAQPNEQAAEQVKRLLLSTYRNFLKAWRHCLDVDGSNKCNWEEFDQGCKKIRFDGDIAGAWRTLDDDLSGYITLAEIDAQAHGVLVVFKQWCNEEFGGVKSAFLVFDTGGDGEVSYREFKRACRSYGFDKDVSQLYKALDVEGTGCLTGKDVSFLDYWETEVDDTAQAEEEEIVKAASIDATPRFAPSDVTGYATLGPGPGSYALPSSVGQGPMSPMVRFSGAYSFRKRPQSMGSPRKDCAHLPAPTSYEGLASLTKVSPKKPSWGFGSERRKANETQLPVSVMPGPAEYAPICSVHRSPPSITCSPRRPLTVHPLFKDGGRPSSRQPRGGGCGGGGSARGKSSDLVMDKPKVSAAAALARWGVGGAFQSPRA